MGLFLLAYRSKELIHSYTIFYLFKFSTWTADCLPSQTWIKGTHARDFRSLFLNLFMHLSITNRYKTQYNQHFRKSSSNSSRYSKFFYHSPISPKARSIAERCRRKRRVKFSVVFVTVRFQRKRGVKLIVVGENGELNCALSAVYSIFRERAELHVFSEWAEWNVAFSLKTRSETVRFRR